MTKWKQVESMNYCKSDLKTGKPIIVVDLIKGIKRNKKRWEWKGKDDEDNRVRFVCEYIEGKKDKSGARVKLLKYVEEK